MGQSTLYKIGSGIATDVNVTDDSSRELGRVEVTDMVDEVDFDMVDDSSRQLGNTQVTNTVETASTTVNGTRSFAQTVDGSESLDSLDVPDGSTLRLLADEDNTEPIYIDDYPLLAGKELDLPVSNADTITVTAEGSQDIYAIAAGGN